MKKLINRIDMVLNEKESEWAKEIIAFVKKQRTWFEDDDSSDKFVEFITRKHGNHGAEVAGKEDVREAYRLSRLLLKKFGKTIKVGVEDIDEWTQLWVEKKK